jgi:hypothetical protein
MCLTYQNYTIVDCQRFKNFKRMKKNRVKHIAQWIMPFNELAESIKEEFCGS